MTGTSPVKELVGINGIVLDVGEFLVDRIIEQLEKQLTNYERRQRKSINARSRFMQLHARAVLQFDELMNHLHYG